MLPERAALFIDVPPVGPYDVGNARWEQAVRTAKRELVDRGFSLALFQNVSGIVREPELQARTLVTREALIFLSDELADLLLTRATGMALEPLEVPGVAELRAQRLSGVQLP